MGREHDTRGDGIPWEGRAIALLDLDAFFASVEQLDHPAWRGRPVIVGGSADKRGVVSTASYEARRYGVHSAMPSYQAQRLCPDAIWTRGHFRRYHELSQQVMSLVTDETPLVQRVSIDEAFFDVSPGRFSRESPIAICRRIQERVSGLGITCSIGLSTSKTVAKIASERQKPRGMTIVLPGTEAEFLSTLPTRSMSGIGKATASKLESMGIHTLGQLATQDPVMMRRAFGSFGPTMVLRAAGLETSAVTPADAPDDVKSVSSERTFARDLTGRDELEAAVRHVSELVGARLRRRGLKGSQVTLKLKFDYEHAHTMQRQLGEASDDEHVFGAVAVGLLDALWDGATGVRLVGVAVSDFGGVRPRQLSLSLDVGSVGDGRTPVGRRGASALRELSVTADAVRERFGKDALSYGRDLRLGEDESDTAPMSGPDS